MNWCSRFFVLPGILFLAKKTSLHKRVFEEKTLPLVGWNKNSGRVDDSPLGREERSCQSFLRKEEFLPSIVAELGWAGSWEFVIFLDFKVLPDSVLLTVVFSVGDWSTVVSEPLPFIPSQIGVIVSRARDFSRTTQLVDLFRSRVSVPRDLLLAPVPFLERWFGQKN